MLNKHTIRDMQAIAKKHNGLCLSKEYINCETPLQWKCEKDHIWSTAPRGIIHHNSWCPKCAIKRIAQKLRLSIRDMQKEARKRGGKCLSKEYINSHTKLKWQCKRGHTWEAFPYSITSNNQWCPKCRVHAYLNEEICRETLENMFNEDFPKKKPEWLKLKDGKRLELDGYSEKLKMGFEYNGIQHYKLNKKYNNNSKLNLHLLQENDILKKNLCKKNNIKLIVIPYTVEFCNFVNYIKRYCEKKSIKIPNKDFRLNLDSLHINVDKSLEKCKKYAISKGGKCLSTKFLFSNSKLLWQCRKGHKWKAVPSSILLSNCWCPKCSNEKRKYSWANQKGKCESFRKNEISVLRNLASKNGGKCLSNKYINQKTKYQWECKKGHKWWAVSYAIKAGQWCPYCKGCYKTIKDINKIAKKMGGKCLSKKYINNRTKLQWQCKKGHKWWAVSTSIIYSNTWCPKCAKNLLKSIGIKRRLTIEEMRKIAKSRNGKCLSKKYTNNSTKLWWQCENGHKWKATPGHIKWGRWCPICAVIRRTKN